MIVKGRVWKFGDDINTDLIFPNVAFRLPEEEQVKLVFQANRPGWVEEVKPGDIIIGGRNFGTGSSRPGAALFKRLGIGALVAESINGLFFRNCMNYGLPAMQCPGVYKIFEEGDIAEINFDDAIVRNVNKNSSVTGQRLPDSLLKLLEAGGNIPLLRTEGYID